MLRFAEQIEDRIEAKVAVRLLVQRVVHPAAGSSVLSLAAIFGPARDSKGLVHPARRAGIPPESHLMELAITGRNSHLVSALTGPHGKTSLSGDRVRLDLIAVACDAINPVAAIAPNRANFAPRLRQCVVRSVLRRTQGPV